MAWTKRLLADLEEMIREQIDYRDLLIQVTARDLLLRYKQTAMGFGWAVFMPLLNTGIFSIVFMRVAPLDVGMPYPLYAYCGLLAWNFFASALRFSVISLTSNANLVSKVYFPREVFPLSAVFGAAADFAVGATVLVGLMLFYGVEVSPAILFLPIVVAVQALFTVGVAFLLAMGNLFYRDVKYLFELSISVWMFSTSVVYPVSLAGGRLGPLMALNPMTPIVDAYRSVLLRGELPAAGPFLAASGVAMLTLAVGWVVFHRAEFAFAENV